MNQFEQINLAMSKADLVEGQDGFIHIIEEDGIQELEVKGLNKMQLEPDNAELAKPKKPEAPAKMSRKERRRIASTLRKAQKKGVICPSCRRNFKGMIEIMHLVSHSHCTGCAAVADTVKESAG